MTLNINIETKNVIKILALATAFTVGVFALMKMRDAIMLILVAFFIALALNPAVDWLSKYMPGKKRGPAIALVYIIVVAIVVLLLSSIASPVIKEISSFAKTLPDSISNLRTRNSKVKRIIDKYQLSDNVDSLIISSKQKVGHLGSKAVDGVGTVTNSLVKTLTVIVMSILTLAGGQKIIKRLADKVYRDKDLRERHEQLLSRMYAVVTGYVNGQVIVAFIASIFAVSILSILRVPYPLPLAAIVFLFGLIPLIGNTIAAILVITLTIVFKNLTSGIIMLAYFIIYQQTENATLQPIIQGRTTQLPPLIIFISVILGVALLGPIGGLFAIPAAGCAKVLLADYLEHRKVEDADEAAVSLAHKVRHKISKVVSPSS